MTHARLWSYGWRLPKEQADIIKQIASQRRLSYTRVLEEVVDTYLHTLPKSGEHKDENGISQRLES